MKLHHVVKLKSVRLDGNTLLHWVKSSRMWSFHKLQTKQEGVCCDISIYTQEWNFKRYRERLVRLNLFLKIYRLKISC